MKKSILIFVFFMIMFLIVNRVAISSSDIYGINSHVPEERIVDLIKNAHIGWARIDIDWFSVEPEKGVYNWKRLDESISYLRAKGINIFATIAYTPSWASSNGEINGVPKNIDDWENFVETVVRRYKGKIKYWGIWNEPNLEKFFSGSTKDYVEKILIPAYKSIKKVGIDNFVVAPAVTYLTGTDSRWDEWLREILGPGKDYIDVVDFHIYDTRGVSFIIEKLEKGSDLLPSVFSVLEEVGVADKQFWITETGWSTDILTDDQQAENYFDMLKYVLNSKRINKIFFYTAMDNEEAGDFYGIIRANYSPKKAYYTYKNFIENEDDFKEEEDDDEKNPCSFKTSFASLSILSPAYKIRDDYLRRFTFGEKIVYSYYFYGSRYLKYINRNPQLKKEFYILQAKLLYKLNNYFDGKNEVIDDDFYEAIDKFLCKMEKSIDNSELKDEIEKFREIASEVKGKNFSEIFVEIKNERSKLRKKIEEVIK